MKMKKFVRIIKSSFFWLVTFLIGVLVLFEAIKYQALLSDLDNNTISEYCGYYTVQKKGPREYSKRYIVELENGDKLEIPTVYVDNFKMFENSNTATFRYSRQKFISSLGLYQLGIHITSIDGTTVYLDESTMADEYKGLSVICYFLSVLIFCIAFLPIWLAMVFQIIIKKPKCKLKQKRKKERK